MAHRAEPPHDRVELTPAERTALERFERILTDQADGEGRARTLLAAGGQRLGRLGARFVRLAPWIAALGVLALVPAISVSNTAGLVCAAAITAAVTTSLLTARGGFERLVIRPAERRVQQERRRREGHP
jgi:hypothetical protein